MSIQDQEALNQALDDLWPEIEAVRELNKTPANAVRRKALALALRSLPLTLGQIGSYCGVSYKAMKNYIMLDPAFREQWYALRPKRSAVAGQEASHAS